VATETGAAALQRGWKNHARFPRKRINHQSINHKNFNVPISINKNSESGAGTSLFATGSHSIGDVTNK